MSLYMQDTLLSESHILKNPDGEISRILRILKFYLFI